MSLHPHESTPLFSSSELTQIEKASWYVESALRGLEAPSLNNASKASRKKYLRFEKSQNPERSIIMLALVLVTFFEVPLWCNVSESVCDAPDGSQIYLSGLPYLSPSMSCPIELVCYALVLRLCYLEACCHGSILRAPLLCRIASTLAALAIADTAWYLLSVYKLQLHPSFRLSPFVRILLLSCTTTAMSTLKSCFSVVPAFAEVLVLVFCVFSFAGWLMAMVMDDVEGYTPRCASSDDLDDCPKANEGFEDLQSSLYTMATVATNADVPDLQIPSYSYFRPLGLFWMTFYVIANFLFLNLALAVVYNEYTESLKKSTLLFFRNRANGLKAAYDTLTGGGGDSRGVTMGQMQELLENVNESEVVAYIPRAHVSYLFKSLDEDRSGFIDLKEFYYLCETLQDSYSRTRVESYLMREHPNISRLLNLQACKRFVENETWSGLHAVVTCVLLVNSVCILLESIQDLSNEYIFLPENTWAWVEFSFSMLYAVELALKLATTSFDKYWLSQLNRFDFFVTVLLLVMSLVWVMPFIDIPHDILRVFTIIRLLRLLELMKKMQRMRFISDCVAKMLAASGPVVLPVFIVTSLFCIAGNQLYGGLVYSSSPELQESDYFDSNFDVLNFNDFGMAFMPFVAMIVSGGPVTDLIEGHGSLSGWGGRNLSVAFFFSYYYFGVLVLFNVFVSFIIDAFIVNFEVKDLEEGVDKLEGFIETEEGYEVTRAKAKGSDILYKKMFEDELEEIFQGNS